MVKGNTGIGNTKTGWNNWKLLDYMTDNSFHVSHIVSPVYDDMLFDHIQVQYHKETTSD